MQLKKPVSIRGALTTATCTLLGTGSNAALAEEAAPSWEFDSAILYYSETDRVTAVEPVISAKKEYADDKFLSLRFVFDSLTGASANGAVAADKLQTFTTPSGNGTYVANANEIPLDPSFHDSRFALSGEWELPLTNSLKGVFGANFSTEYDYTSAAVSATFLQDFNNRNTTLTAGISVGNDTVSPVGGIPVALSQMPTTASNKKQIETDSDTKTVGDILIGVTQVINHKTLMQLNYSYGQTNGYLTDPYKILSVVDSGGNLVTGNPTDTYTYLYESRPDSRAIQSVYWKYVHQFKDDVINLSYRYFWDDWDITTHTLDLHYRYELNPRHFLQPHLRYSMQSAASFYQFYLEENNTPEYASADYRLGDLTTSTIGLQYGFAITKNSAFTVRAEYMLQSGDSPNIETGDLKNQDLFPDVTAYIFQAGYTIKF